MTMIYIIIGVIILAAIVVKMFGSSDADTKLKPVYEYKKREHLLTDAEREFYNLLVQSVGNEYSVFSQVHLSSLIEYVDKDDSWKAWAHVGQKSVDFVLCDKASLVIRLAIEVDDKTHSRPDRLKRDSGVEDILLKAGVKLIRFKNHGTFNSQEITQQIKTALA